MTYNVHYNKGMDDETNVTRLANFIKKTKADIIGMQEVDKNTNVAEM